MSEQSAALGSVSAPAVMTEMQMVERHLERDLIRCEVNTENELAVTGNSERKE